MCECMSKRPPAWCPSSEERVRALRDGYVSAGWGWFPDGRRAPRADDDPTPPCGGCVGPCQCRRMPLGLDELDPDSFSDEELADFFSPRTSIETVDPDNSVEIDPGLRKILDNVADAIGDLGKTLLDTIGGGSSATQRQQQATAQAAAARQRETVRTILVVGVGALAILAVLKHRRG